MPKTSKMSFILTFYIERDRPTTALQVAHILAEDGWTVERCLLGEVALLVNHQNQKWGGAFRIAMEFSERELRDAIAKDVEAKVLAKLRQMRGVEGPVVIVKPV